MFSQRKAWFESHQWIILKTIAQSYREEEEDYKQALRNLGGSLKWKRRKKKSRLSPNEEQIYSLLRETYLSKRFNLQIHREDNEWFLVFLDGEQ